MQTHRRTFAFTLVFVINVSSREKIVQNNWVELKSSEVNLSPAKLQKQKLGWAENLEAGRCKVEN